MRALLLFFLGTLAWCQSPGEQRVQDLLEKARGTKTRKWTALLIQADAEAAKLAIKNATACCGIRHVLIPPDYQLSYRWNDIAHEEEYEHDLLKLVIRTQEGTSWGASALVAFLRDLNRSGEAQLAPLFKTALEMVDAPRWRVLRDPRLIRIEAEAYETWWSLSKAPPNDPALTDNEVRASDFSKGADHARLAAIAAYTTVLKGHNDSALRRRVNELRAGHDTHQRLWYRIGD